MNGRMKDIESALEDSSFAMCNRYCLVNLQYVAGMQGGKVLVNGAQIPVSRGKKEDLFKALSAYISGT